MQPHQQTMRLRHSKCVQMTRRHRPSLTGQANVDRRGTHCHSAGGPPLPSCLLEVRLQRCIKSLEIRVLFGLEIAPQQRFAPRMLLEEFTKMGGGLFTAAENWEHPECPTSCNMLSEGWSTHVME